MQGCIGPIACVELIQQPVHRHKAAIDELLYAGLTCERHVVVQTKESDDETVQQVCRGINSHIFKEDTVLSNRRTDAAIKHIAFKSSNHAFRNFEKLLLLGELICTRQYRNAAPLRRGR